MTCTTHRNKSNRGIIFLTILACLIAIGCSLSASSNDIDIDNFSDELKQILPSLSNSDEFQVRHAIGEIPLTHDPHAKALLEALWNQESINGVDIKPSLLLNPIVRSKIAQGLISLGHADSKYIDYVKSLTENRNPTVLIVGLEALRDVNDKESMKLLSGFASHSNPKIAELAISGIRHYVDYGRHKEYAYHLWEEINENPDVDQDVVRQYELMYINYKKSINERMINPR
jgi:hypothetical protein